MKMLKKLALVSAVSMISAGAFAMEAMDDASMAATTGQDGITVKIKPPTGTWTVASGTNPFASTANQAGILSIDNVYIHDKDGMTGGATAGAITLSGMKIAGSAPIQLDIDADGGAGGNSPTLNIAVTMPSTFIVRTGDIGVAGSNRGGKTASDIATADRGIVAGSNVVVLNSLDLSLGGTTMNIQLGNEVQTGSTGTTNASTMIKVSGSIANGLTITGLTLKDTSPGVAAPAVPGVSPRDYGTGGGEIYVGTINLRDNGGTALTLATDIDISANGLIISMGGTATTDILMNDVRLGNKAAVLGASPALDTNPDTTKSIGDIEVVGMKMIGTKIIVSGH